MTDEIFATLTAYHVDQELLKRAGDNTGNCGLYKRTQTPLGGVTATSELDDLEHVIQGPILQLKKGEARKMMVGTSERCDLKLPDYLDYVGAGGFGVQAEIDYDGSDKITVRGNARWTNRVDGNGLARLQVYELQSNQPHLVALGDWFKGAREQQQTQAVLRVEYK